MLGNSIPKVKCAVRTGGAECAVLRVKGDGVDGINVGHIVLRRVSVAFEGKVRTIDDPLIFVLWNGKFETHAASFSSTY
jgi:hypothetical protein